MRFDKLPLSTTFVRFAPASIGLLVCLTLSDVNAQTEYGAWIWDTQNNHSPFQSFGPEPPQSIAGSLNGCISDTRLDFFALADRGQFIQRGFGHDVKPFGCGSPWDVNTEAHWSDFVFSCEDGRSDVTAQMNMDLNGHLLLNNDNPNNSISFRMEIRGMHTSATALQGNFHSAANMGGAVTASTGIFSGHPLPDMVFANGKTDTLSGTFTGSAFTVPTGAPSTLHFKALTRFSAFKQQGSSVNPHGWYWFDPGNPTDNGQGGFSFPVNGPAFVLPEGCSCNSVDANIVDNQWRGVEPAPSTVSIDGILSACDGPIAGVSLFLLDGGSEISSAVTGAGGEYSFVDVPASVGLGTIDVIPPTGYEVPGIIEVSLETDGIVDIVIECVYSSVSGTVSSDCGEGALDNVSVSLLDAGGVALASTVSDVLGVYSFSGLRATDLEATVGVVSPAGYEAVAPTTVDITSDQTSVDFSLPCEYVDVYGSVVADCDGPNEGATVTLIDGSGTESATATAVDGTFSFLEIRWSETSGQIDLTVPAGYQSATTGGESVSVDLAISSSGIDFALTCASVGVSGLVNAPCAGGAIEGAEVNLSDAGGGVYSTFTDAAGMYSFEGVPYSDLVDGGNVWMPIPLGYTADTPDQHGEYITLDGDQVVEFYLGCASNADGLRGLGYWKTDYLKAAGYQNGNYHESYDDLATVFPSMIFEHFYDNGLAAIQVKDVTFVDGGGTQVAQDLASVAAFYKVKAKGDKLVSAKQHYLALLLNLASGRLHSSSIVSDDGADASQAVQAVAMLINNGSRSDWITAKDISETINEGGRVGAGDIDLDIDPVAYRNPGGAAIIVPDQTLLHGAMPSPFQGVTTLGFDLAKAGPVHISIYSVAGRSIRSLVDSEMSAGSHHVEWDGRDDVARQVSPGVYFIRFTAPGYAATQNIVMTR